MASPELRLHDQLSSAEVLYITRDWQDAERLNDSLAKGAAAVPYNYQLAGYMFKEAVVLAGPFEDVDYVWLREILTPTLGNLPEGWWTDLVDEYYSAVENPPRPQPVVFH